MKRRRKKKKIESGTPFDPQLNKSFKFALAIKKKITPFKIVNVSLMQKVVGQHYHG